MSKGSAFVPHDLPAPIRGAAVGPLAGLSCVVKDMFDIAGQVAGAGNPAWLASHGPATANAEAVTRLLSAGAAITGKTACDEFFYSLLGMNAHYGTPINPRTPDRVPGGSSSGSAAAVASGAADFALGSDTGGSVRIPAMANGIYGIRTTHGRVSLQGALPLAPSFDTAGWFAASAGLLRKVGPVLLQATAPTVPVRRVLHARGLLGLVDREVADVFTRFAGRSAGILPAAEPCDLAPQDLDGWREIFRIIQGYEAWQAYGAWLGSHKAELGPGTKERFEQASMVTSAAVEAARSQREQIFRHLRAAIPEGAVLVLPTAPALSPLLTASAGELDLYRKRVMGFTCIAGLGGLPQISIPAGNAGGVPVGVSLIGWPGADEALLDLAVSLSPFCGD